MRTAAFTLVMLVLSVARGADMPSNRWVELARDAQGARRASAFRWVESGSYFLLWGFAGHITDDYGNPEQPWTREPGVRSRHLRPGPRKMG